MAVEKATNNDVCGPKEKHVQTLLKTVESGASIADVTFLVKYLNRQIVDATRWTTMLKTHILLHRLLHNSGDEFKDQLRRMQKWVEEDRATDSRIKCMFSVRNWKDDSSADANELSQWTRAYAAYLEEVVVNLDKIPRLDRLAAGSNVNEATEMRECAESELMEKLPRVQNVMRRLLDCETVDSLTANDAVVAGVSLLLKDSFKLYRLVNDGIIRLIDVFFQMRKLNALKALDAYKRATHQGDDLERLFRACNSWPSFRDTKFPHIENPPPSFMQTMEEYARAAPAETPEEPVQQRAQQRHAAPAPVAVPAQTNPMDHLMREFAAPSGGRGLAQTSSPAPAPVVDHFSAAPAPVTSLTDAFAMPAQTSPPAAPAPAVAPPPQMGGGGDLLGGLGPSAVAPAPVQATPPAQGGDDPFGMAKLKIDLNALYNAPQQQGGNLSGAGAGTPMGGGHWQGMMQQSFGGMGTPQGTGVGNFRASPGQVPPHMM